MPLVVVTPVVVVVAAALATLARPAGAQSMGTSSSPTSVSTAREGPARAALAAAGARLEYERAVGEYERTRELHRRRMASDADLEARRLDADRARLAWAEATLGTAAALAAPHVMIDRAAKGRTPDGRTTVRLTLRNASGGGAPVSLGASGSTGAGTAFSLGVPAGDSAAYAAIAAADTRSAAAAAALPPADALDAALRRAVGAGGELRDLFVSLKADPGPNGTTVSIPYERHVASLPRGRSATVVFELYRDLPELVVSVSYADRVEERRVFLDRDGGSRGAPPFAIQSAQPSQEADLGAQALFDLRVDRLAAGDVARLVAVGVPTGVTYEFRDADARARLTQIRFADGEETRRLQLAVALPQRATAAVRPDVPFRFTVAARGAGEPDALPASGGASTGADGVSLELVPRGLPRVELRAINLYHELAPADSAVTEVVVRNSGSRALDALQLRADAPPEWRIDFDPASIPALAVDAERPVRLVVHAPASAAVGDYEARVRVAAAAADHRLETDDKVLRLHVAEHSSPLSILAALALVALVAGGMTVAGRRWMRR